MMHPFAHADLMLRWLLQDDEKVRRRVTYQLMANGLAFGMFYMMSLGGQSTFASPTFTDIAPWAPLAALSGSLALLAVGPFPFLFSYGATTNLARTATEERLVQVPDIQKQLQTTSKVTWFTNAWWIFICATQIWLGHYDFLLFPIALFVAPRLMHRLGQLGPDAYPNGQADLDAAVSPPKGRFLGLHALSFLALGLATLLGLLAGPFGLLLLVPLTVGWLASLHGRVHRGARLRDSLRATGDDRLLALRWGHGLRQRWFAGTLATTVPLSLQLAGSTFLLLPAAWLLWTHGPTGLRMGMLTEHSTVVLLLALPMIVLTMVSNGLSAFTFQVHAIWRAQQVEQLQEGQGMEALLQRLEEAREAA